MAFLRLEALTKRFGDAVAVEDFTLEVAKGEFVSLLGPSGCGKTTTLQMIAGFVDPSAGRILLDGKDITSIKPNHRGLGIVFQSYALFPHMTVFENVSFGLEMRAVGRAERRQRVDEALELVHLTPYADRYPRELSGGQRQRVALARALVIRPPVLLLDEPLSNLDAKLREDMQLELREIQRSVGTTTILVTHDQAEALSMSDRVVVMNGGRVVQIASPYDAYEFPQTEFVSNFVGKTNLLPAEVTRVADAAAEIRIGAQSLTLNTAAGARLGSAKLSIRPEKLRLTEAGHGRLQGRIQTRLFHGNHWLYQVESGAGTLLVTAPNDSRAPVTEGSAVGVDWSAGEARLLQDADHA